MKPVVAILSLLLLLINCSEHQQKAPATNAYPDTVTSITHLDSVNNKNVPEAVILYRDTAIIKNEPYIIVHTGNNTLYIFNDKNDTLIHLPEMYGKPELIDFNRDGFKDVLFTYLSNTPGDQDLLLFERKSKKFFLVKNFSWFPAAEPVDGTIYYYAYHRSGCADMNWDSDLFYIKNFQAFRIGNIAGFECSNTGKKDGIYISRVRDDKELLYDSLPINTIYSYKDRKWGFIKAYWKKHYRQFH